MYIDSTTNVYYTEILTVEQMYIDSITNVYYTKMIELFFSTSGERGKLSNIKISLGDNGS
jgi:hypothetical protein